MSAPGTYILGLRQGRLREREIVAAETGIGVERQRWIEDGVAVPSASERKAYAKYFGFESLDDFDSGWRSKAIPLTRSGTVGRIPVLNLAPAGLPGEYFEMYPDSGIGMAYIDPPVGISGPNLFAFVIVGASMEPNYPDGFYAICRTVAAEEIENGQAVFVRLGASRDHTCTFKRCFIIDNKTVELRPINSTFSSEFIERTEIDRMSPVIACIARQQALNGGPDIEYSQEYSQTLNDEQST